jgi:SAM-dependent methyltransferase
VLYPRCVDQQTIAIYDASAAYYSTSRQVDSDRAPQFRRRVGDGLIVDLGCGTGRYLRELGVPTVGLDASLGMLQFARLAQPERVLQADLEALPLADGSVGGCFASFCLQHLPRSNVPTVLRDIWRALRIGGLLEVSLQEGDYEGRHRPGDDLPGRWYSFWNLADLLAVVEEVGCEVIEIGRLSGGIRVSGVRS